MGSYQINCCISNIIIEYGQRCCLIPIVKSYKDEGGYIPTALPIFGTYDDYGRLANIEENQNTKLIEAYFGVSIDGVVGIITKKFISDEAFELLETNGKLDEIWEWEYMWVDGRVYSLMSEPYRFFATDNGFDIISENLSKLDTLRTFGWIFGNSAVVEFDDFMYGNGAIKPLWRQYLDELDVFGEAILGLVATRCNLGLISSSWRPYTSSLTPQNSSHYEPQKLLDGFAEINRGYIQ